MDVNDLAYISTQKCNNQEETFPTEVLENEIGIITIPLCQICKRFGYS